MTDEEKKKLQEIIDELRDYFNNMENTNFLANARLISSLQGLIEDSEDGK